MERASDVIRAIDLGAMGFVPVESNAELHGVEDVMNGVDVRAARVVGSTDAAARGVGVMRPGVAASGAPEADARRNAPGGAVGWRTSASRRARPRCWALLPGGAAQQADRAPAQPVGGDRTTTSLRRCAALNAHAHAGRARRQPDDAGRPAPAGFTVTLTCATGRPFQQAGLRRPLPCQSSGAGPPGARCSCRRRQCSPAPPGGCWCCSIYRRRGRRGCWLVQRRCATLWLLRLAHYLRFRCRPDADDATPALATRRVLVVVQRRVVILAAWLFWGLRRTSAWAHPRAVTSRNGVGAVARTQPRVRALHRGVCADHRAHRQRHAATLAGRP